MRRCRSCSCTDQWGCDEGCEWVEPDLCSSCVEGEDLDVELDLDDVDVPAHCRRVLGRRVA